MHQKGKESSYMLTALSLPKASTAPCQAVFSEPPFPPAGKENPGGTTSSPTQHCGSLCGNPYSSLAPQGLQGNLWDSTTGTLTIMKGGEGLATTSTWILADLVHICSPRSPPNQQFCLSTESSLGCTLTGELGERRRATA